MIDAAREVASASLTASALRIPISESINWRPKREEWQEDAWAFYDEIGEVKFANNFLGWAMSRIRFFAAERPSSPEEEPKPTTNQKVIDAVNRLKADAEFKRKLTINLMIPGEAYLYGVSVPRKDDVTPTERWGIASQYEVATGEGKGFKIEVPWQKDKVLVDDNDFFARIWIQHPKRSSLADSPMRGVLAVCDELIALDHAVRALARNRAAGNGFLLVPSELDWGAIDSSANPGQKSTFEQNLHKALLTPIASPNDATAVVPPVIRGPAEILKEFRHVTLDRKIDQMLDMRTVRAQNRLAQGLNVPVEAMLGKSATNHWQAWLVKEETFTQHIEPLAILIYEALTSVFLIPTLVADDVMSVDEAEQFVLWGDPSKLIVRPDRGEDAKDAHKAHVISDSALRRTLRFADSDAPDSTEVLVRVLLERGQIAPEIAEVLMRILAPNLVIPNISNGQAGPGRTPTSNGGPKGDPGTDRSDRSAPDIDDAEDGLAASAVTAPPPRDNDLSTLGVSLAAIDQSLLGRLHAAADFSMTRVLERIGTRLQSHARKDTVLRDVAKGDKLGVASRLGSSFVAALNLSTEQLLDGAFADLKQRFAQWTAMAARDSVAILPDLSNDARADLLARLAAASASAWSWLERELNALALDRMYEPDPRASDEGEFDSTMRVAFGLIRIALALAGSETFSPAGQGFHLAHPTGGIATGDLVNEALASVFVAPTAYVWRYGVLPRREFPPHKALDGVEFSSFSDDTLQSDTTWMSVTHYAPGDHDGCQCSFEPKYERMKLAAIAAAATVPVFSGKE